MNQEQTLHRSSVVLIVLIAAVTSVYFVLAHDSGPFLTIWVFLLVVSLVKATWRTLIYLGPGWVRNKSRDQRKSKRRCDKEGPKNAAKSAPDVNIPLDTEQIQKDSGLSLDDYLARTNYQLNDQIFDAIEWKRFEFLCHLIFKAKGFISRLTPDGADEGVDIRVYDKSTPNKANYLVQCKKFTPQQKVSRPTIQQLKGQMAAEEVEKGGFCTTSSFTQPAREFARSNNIELFDRQRISKSFNELPSVVRRAILGEVLKNDYWTPSCGMCGEKCEKMRSRNGDLFWGCKNFRTHGGNGIKYYDARPIDTTLRGRYGL